MALSLVDSQQCRSTRQPGWTFRLLFAAVLVLLCSPLTGQVHGSLGDRAVEYQVCVERCVTSRCQRLVDNVSVPVEDALPWHLRLLRWTCTDDCRYHCQHEVSAKRVARGEPVLQYHGKWPFTRLFGIQEPASVLFSILNGYGHWVYLPRLLERVMPRYYLRCALIGYALVGLNMWIWSATFHTRDTPLTEKLDYFSAALGILYGLYLVVCRITLMRNPLVRRIWQAFLALLFLMHISYLTFRHRFDYSYNIAVCATAGVLHSLIWGVWAWRHRNRPYAWRAPAAGVWLTAAMMLELFDFPPLFWALDAHSLWHAATIPVVIWWYRFLLLDHDWEVRTQGDRVLLPLTTADTARIPMLKADRSRKLQD